jgi:hypothetical protein
VDAGRFGTAAKAIEFLGMIGTAYVFMHEPCIDLPARVAPMWAPISRRLIYRYQGPAELAALAAFISH